MGKKNLIGLSVNEIFSIIRPGGFEFHHAVSIANAVYKKRTTNFSTLTKIPKKLALYLSQVTDTEIYKPLKEEVSVDSTIKYLFRNIDGKLFETVFIPDGKRNTVCISIQSGCRMGCPFCATSKYGFHGDLSAGDVLNQVLGIPSAGKITHVVFMGMGEPLDNLECLLKTCMILTAEWGMALSPRNITVSTVGITPSIITFLGRSECNLALSLFSPFPEERILSVPAEKLYPAQGIIDIMKSFPLRKKRRLSIAYVMIEKVNDTERHLAGLISLLKNTGIRVNLLPYHPLPGDLQRSSNGERMLHFRHILAGSGISASVRRSRGADISAACGLLASGLIVYL